MSSIAHRLEVTIREDTAFLSNVPWENIAARARLMALLESTRLNITRAEALQMEVLIEKRTGYRREESE